MLQCSIRKSTRNSSFLRQACKTLSFQHPQQVGPSSLLPAPLQPRVLSALCILHTFRYRNHHFFAQLSLSVAQTATASGVSEIQTAIVTVTHGMLSKLDGYRVPAATALTPPKPVGGILRLAVLAVWLLYVTFSTIEYLNKPEVIVTNLVPAGEYLNNTLQVSIVNPNVTAFPTFFWGKYGNFPACDRVSNFADVMDPDTPLCPHVLGMTPCGVNTDGEDILVPQGPGYVYMMENEDDLINILDYDWSDMFEIRTKSGDTWREWWVDAWPRDQSIPTVTGEQLILAITTVTVGFQHNLHLNGSWTTKLMGTSVVMRYEAFDLTDTRQNIQWCTKNLGYGWNANTSSPYMTVSLGGDNVTYLEPKFDHRGYRGFGVINFETTETTVVQETRSGRQPTMQFLGSLGGGFGLL